MKPSTESNVRNGHSTHAFSFMTENERLTIIRKHVEEAQRILGDFKDPGAGIEPGVPLGAFLRQLERELGHWELTSALRTSGR